MMTIIQTYSIVINWKGKGLNNYSQSFSTYLIQTTIGKYSIIKEIIVETPI